MSSAPSVEGAVLAGTGARTREVRYTFLDHADEERAVAAFELFVSSEEDACKLANELWRGPIPATSKYGATAAGVASRQIAARPTLDFRKSAQG